MVILFIVYCAWDSCFFKQPMYGGKRTNVWWRYNQLSFDACIDLASIKNNTVDMWYVMCWAKKSLFSFSLILWDNLPEYQSSKVCVSRDWKPELTTYFRTSLVAHFWGAAMISLRRNHAEAGTGNMLQTTSSTIANTQIFCLDSCLAILTINLIFLLRIVVCLQRSLWTSKSPITFRAIETAS